MNRILRSDGAWYRRNGPKGTGIAWNFNLDEPVIEPLNLNQNVLFNYTPGGLTPEGAYGDQLLDFGVVFNYTPGGLTPEGAYGDQLMDFNVLFNYTPGGLNPEGAYEDNLTLGTDIVNFTYTL